MSMPSNPTSATSFLAALRTLESRQAKQLCSPAEARARQRIEAAILKAGREGAEAWNRQKAEEARSPAQTPAPPTPEMSSTR
jgi:hypothetical protein